MSLVDKYSLCKHTYTRFFFFYMVVVFVSAATSTKLTTLRLLPVLHKTAKTFEEKRSIIFVALFALAAPWLPTREV